MTSYEKYSVNGHIVHLTGTEDAFACGKHRRSGSAVPISALPDEPWLRCERCFYPEIARTKLEVRSLVTRALARGLITRASACDQCGHEGRILAHHSDYERPFKIDWLCRACHADWHHDHLRDGYGYIKRPAPRPDLVALIEQERRRQAEELGVETLVAQLGEQS